MSGQRNSFYKERTVPQIRALRTRDIYRPRGLTHKLLDLDPAEESLIICFPIIPARFKRHNGSWREAALKCAKHGNLIKLSQPKLKKDALASPEIPLTVRERDLSALQQMPEELIPYIGYCYEPVWSRDKEIRIVPADSLLEGTRLFAFAENIGGKIEVKPYDDSRAVEEKGAEVVVRIPSRRKGEPAYLVKLVHIPVFANNQRKALAWSLKSRAGEGAGPLYEVYSTIAYRFLEDPSQSDTFTFFEQTVAAHIATLGYYWNKKNFVPMEMSPLALSSKALAEFYRRVCNNFLIRDPTVTKKPYLRKPYRAEKSILLMRAVGALGHDATLFWDPQRDGSMRTYDWSIPS